MFPFWVLVTLTLENWPVPLCKYSFCGIAVYTNYFYDTSVISVTLSSHIWNLSQVRLTLHRSWPTDRCNWHRLVLYQYHFIVLENKLNNVTIWTCLRKGLWISIRDYRSTTTGVERKWRQVYVKSFEKKLYLTSAMWNSDNSWKNLLRQGILTKTIRIVCWHVIL